MVGNIGACCLGLIASLGPKVLLPDSTGYDDSLSSYFGQQVAQTQPACIVNVSQASDVTTALKTISKESRRLKGRALDQCRFAVRSGGHSVIEDAANINGGVTLDLSALSSVNLAGSVVSVGPGASWDEVYSVLDAAGRGVAGGRTGGVGVGGLTTGGGISFFSPRYGWTADTVVNYQVALADGRLVSANARSNPDLLWALRGGSNNFGVVTRVDLQTFEQGQLWGGFSFHDASTIDANLQALVDFSAAETYDDYSSLITTFGKAPGQPASIANNYVYTQPVENPPALRGFTSIPALFSTLRLAPMTNFAEELAAQQTYDARQLMATLTHKATLPFMEAAWVKWLESTEATQAVTNLTWSLSFEPAPPSLYARNANGNALGLKGRQDSLVVTVLTASWADSADDATVESVGRGLIEDLQQEAKRLNAHDPFLYLNYAAEWQDPIATYGKENVARLNKIRRRYDPNAVFTKLVPGGFKIPAR